MVGIAIRFGNFIAASPKQKLLPHFSETRAAIFAIENIENGGLDRTRSFAQRCERPRYTRLLACER